MLKPHVLLLFLFCAPLTHAKHICPTAEEWRALKARAFFNRQFAAASMCGSVILNIEQRNGEARHKLTVTYREFYEEQLRLASEYYARAGRGGRSTDGYNAQLGSDEIRLLNRTSVEAGDPAGTLGSDRYAFCSQASDSLDIVLDARTPEEMMAALQPHPYASEHNVQNCSED